ncbi:hypothetical protein SLA2020_101570 [Shorea laevis]
MVNDKAASDGLEWRIKVNDGSSEVLAPKATTCLGKVWLGVTGIVSGLFLKVWSYLKKAWKLGADDPRKVIHCLKVGLALTVVSLFYFMRPLNEGVGGNAIWAVMTVVVVFEQTVGATICKCLNRVFGTFLAGFLALGVNWVACHSQKFQPLIIGASVFVLASAATFSRFIPTVKTRFDYGATIFILTFSLIAISGYRMDTLFDVANQRISTIVIGTSLCILIIMLICPIWAGQELHSLITRNMEKLANSLNGCVEGYFIDSGETTKTDDEEAHKRKLLGYKCVLSSKAAEESMANFARWEPAHGRFSFRHPWKQYLKIGASMRACACCLEALIACLDSDNKAPEFIKKHLCSTCLELSSSSANVIREAMKMMETMKMSSTMHLLVEEMNKTMEELHKNLRSLPCLLHSQEAETPEKKKTGTVTVVPLMEIIPVMTFTSMLMEISVKIEALVDSVSELADLAKFEIAKTDKSLQNQTS